MYKRHVKRLPNAVPKDSRKFKKVLEGSRRFKKVQKGSRLKKFQEVLRRF